MLIDDSITELRVLIDLLAARKWRVVVAFDGLDGYRKAVAKQPDLILLDVQMPGLDGFGTCRRLKADPRTRDIPVLFLTAAQDRLDRLTGLSIGAVDYVVKPYACEEEVLARVGIHLELAQRCARPATNAATVLAEVSEQSALVTAATSLLLAKLSDPPTPRELAHQLGTNEKRLNEAFHKAFGLPVFGWLREQRLQTAWQLLSTTLMPIADIAAHCGYGNAANFSTAFRERFDCTPRACRQRAGTAAQGC